VRSVNVNAPQTIGMLAFNSANTYTVGGPGTITLDGSAGVVAAYVVNGSHVIDAPVVLNDDLNVTVVPQNSTLAVSNLQASSVNIAKNGAGALVVNNIRAAGLTINDGTVVTTAGASRVGLLALI